MAKLKLVFEADWDYSLYRGADGYIVSVVIDEGDVDEINIPVSDEDAVLIQQGDQELIEQIRAAPKKFAARHVEITQADLK
ncbi:hypothetical protein BH09PSE6_BH09PSE6_00180 [soil metagenome]